MKLAVQILVNWGQMRAGDYDMGAATLFTGETGAGKSTMLDSLQAIMTGGHKNVMNFNPGQDEVGQGSAKGKTKRSIESYVVGAEYSKFSRPDGAHAYIGGVFLPGPGETARPFTALMAVAAHVESGKEGSARHAVAESTQLFILDGVQLTYADVMHDAEKGECIPVEDIAKHLKQRFPHVLEFGNRKSDYLCSLFGRFRGRPGPATKDEAFAAARAWVQSIAYRPIGSVNELVRNEILEFDPVQLSESVNRIGSLMRQVSELRREADYLRTSEESLAGLGGLLAGVRTAHVDSLETAYLALKAGEQSDTSRTSRLTESIEQARGAIQDLEVQQEGLNAQKTELDTQRTMVQARMLGIPGQQQKQAYEEKIAAAEMVVGKALREALQGVRAAVALQTRAKSILADAERIPRNFSGLDPVFAALKEAFSAVEKSGSHAVMQELEALLAQPLETDTVRGAVARLKSLKVSDFEALHQALVGNNDSSLLFGVTRQSTLLEQQLLDAERKVTDLTHRNAKLSTGSVSYPGATGHAIERIREEFPAAHAQVLCDLIDPISPAWQPAIEAYMGKARFNVLVAPEWERQVIDFVRAQRLDARVVQGSLCLERRQRMDNLPPESIVRELSTANTLAEAYLYDQFGLVVKVETSEQLRQTPRGLMKDGKASGGRTMYVANTKELFFGKAARNAQATNATQLLAEAERDRVAVKSLEGVLTALRMSLANLKAPAFEIPDTEAPLSDISAAHGALKALDLSAADGLADEAKRLTSAIKETDKQLSTARDGVTRHQMSIEQAERQLKALGESSQRAREASRAAAGRLITLQRQMPAYNAGLRMSQLDDQAAEKSGAVDALHEHSAEQSRVVMQEMAKVREALSAFNQTARLDERFVDALPFHVNDGLFDLGFVDTVKLEVSVQERLTNLRSLGLLNTNAKLDQAVASFNDVFTKQFCLEIRTRVEDGVRTLRQINNELKNLKFGYDRYTLDWARWVPEMREYLDFFEAVTLLTAANEELDLFGSTTLEARHVVVRDKLVALLLDEDQERAQKELMRIADYRNYRYYDIVNHSEHGGEMRLSEWGTGSGGQLETPAYVVRAAVLTNRLRCFDKGASLRLMVSDESFAKMDEARSRAVLHFMRDILGFQLICAMPTTKSTAILDEFTNRYGFTRLEGVPNGELDFMTEVNAQVLAREKMGQAWNEQRVRAQEQARLAFEAENPPGAENDEGGPQALAA